jgi:replicative DNA helicase
VNNTYVSTQKMVTQDDHKFTDAINAICDKFDDPSFFGGKHGIPTGIKLVDDTLLHKGVAAGELMLFIGPPGSGKSPALMNCAAHQILMGYDVLYYTLELSSDINDMRLMSCFSGIPVNELSMNGKAIRERMDILRSKRKMGQLIVIDLPANALKPSHVRRDIRRYRDLGYNLKSFIIDYQQLMKSDRAIALSDRRLEYGDVCLEIRSIAKDEKIAGFSAVQGNRGALNRVDVDIDCVAEDYSAAFTADYVLGISQTKKEKEMKHASGMGAGGQIRLFVGKNRNEKKGDNIYLWPDFSKMRLSMIDWSHMDHEVYGLPLIA